MVESAAGSRIRAARLQRGFSLRELGSRVGVSASMLSQLENGRCQASVATLYRLVTELGITLDDLFGAAPAADAELATTTSTTTGIPVSPNSSRVSIELESGVTWERLSDGGPPGLELILVTYRPGSASSTSGRFSSHEGFECAYVETGELTFHHASDTWTVRAGDSLTFDASVPHRLENRGASDVRAVWLVLRDRPPVVPAQSRTGRANPAD